MTIDMEALTEEMWDRFTTAMAETGTMRAALEEITPRILAQGMREAAEIEGDSADQSQGWLNDLVSRKAILARAQELDPQ
jgi:hypothetical protein